MSNHRMHIILNEKHKAALAELEQATGMNASDVVRLLIVQAQRNGIKGVTK